ncbi:MAG: trypsin-like peptidase domain-containing protein [Planctomycetes bacterium]|nr:trypsin-like peptidase domain-containing protein [Planctomycetota bacterium]MCB9891805.1 trypsin-like peptidase domain-containing protein [Planctomycetota bacterium]
MNPSYDYDIRPYGGPPRPARANFLLALLVLGLGTWVAYLLWDIWFPGAAPRAHPRPVVERGELFDLEKRTVELFEDARGSVVSVTRYTGLRRGMFTVEDGQGSGFVWDEYGHVVTNYHVVLGSRGQLDASPSFQIRTSDGRSYDADYVGGRPDYDLAVLRLRRKVYSLTPIRLGRSSTLRVGQSVFAIGNPFGYDQTLTTGILSALGRQIQAVDGTPIRNVIQIDAAINPGNSGGPLLDSEGLLIGVNTAIASRSGESAGIGFAIPVDTVNQVVPAIINHEEVPKPLFGVRMSDANRGQWDGVLVVEVVPGTPAARIGIQPGDVILEFDGKPVVRNDDLGNAVSRRQLGEEVHVRWKREEKEYQASVPLFSQNVGG